jgi:hypothetical protein
MHRPFGANDVEGVDTLELLQMCDVFKTLPRPGGLLDQDSLFVHLMWSYLQSVEERKAKDAPKK